MSLLPWDDWFYHLSQKHAELDEDYNKYMRLRDDYYTNGDQFNKKLDALKVLQSYNLTLLIVLHYATVNDSDYIAWLKANEVDKPPTILDRSSVVTVSQSVRVLFVK